MIKKTIVKFLKYKGFEKVNPDKVKQERTIRPYKQDFSILNSKEYVLEERQERKEVLNLIRTLIPNNTEKKLIRIGAEGDGGYLVPNDFDGITACFSAGVGDVSSFEKECYDLGMDLFLADKSVVKANLDVKHNFLSKFIGCTNNDDFITMDNWTKNKVNDGDDLLLQMDIEGAEYNAFISMSDSLISSFRIMVIEFHDLQRIWSKFSFDVISNVFKKILQTHICVHIHPNNCCGIDVQEGIEIPRVAEFTFIRKDRVKKTISNNTFPNPLDFDNTNYPSIDLPEIWYKVLNIK